MELLRLRGKYHGNFSLENTYYLIKERKIVVKLANFKKKGEKNLLIMSTNRHVDRNKLGICKHII